SSGNTSEGDIIKKAKTLRHQKFSTYLKDRYNKLNVYEIENLLTPEVIKKTVSYFESNKDSIAEFNSFSQESYSKIPLGRFLDSNIINKKVKSYSADSGTIKRKLEFAKEAISHVKCKEDISDEAWELAEKVYNFIKQNNN
ncbi:MAG: hypothetical protein ACXWEY_03345, partial [Bacteroidia bacterium]